MTLFRSGLAITALLVLTLAQGCALREFRDANPDVGLRDALTTVAIDDLAKAYERAVAADDVIAAVCFRSLGEYLATLPKIPSGETMGAFEAFERARILRLRIEKGMPDQVKIGCAALVSDEKALLLKLGLIASGKPPL